jgi:hypothetical protein
MAVMTIDWDAEATKMAVYVNERMFAAHRGAMPWKEVGVAVVFGNDGYGIDGEPDVRGYVALLRRSLEDAGIPILGFGVDPGEGYSWAMLVRTDRVELLRQEVWQSWQSEAIRETPVIRTEGITHTGVAHTKAVRVKERRNCFHIRDLRR